MVCVPTFLFLFVLSVSELGALQNNGPYPIFFRSWWREWGLGPLGLRPFSIGQILELCVWICPWLDVIAVQDCPREVEHGIMVASVVLT